MPETIKLSVPFTAICIDDERRPVEIKPEKWVKKNRPYTVIGIGRTIDGSIGFQLKEIVLGKESYPFDCFAPIRFAIPYQPKTDALAEELADLGIEVEEIDLMPNE